MLIRLIALRIYYDETRNGLNNSFRFTRAKENRLTAFNGVTYRVYTFVLKGSTSSLVRLFRWQRLEIKHHCRYEPRKTMSIVIGLLLLEPGVSLGWPFLSR